jgi:SAM-dependent methyltransferase
MLTREGILKLESSHNFFCWPVPKVLEDLQTTQVREQTVQRILQFEDIEFGAASQSATTPSMLRDILKVSQDSFGIPQMEGVGIELGAGIGLFGIVVAENEKVDKLLTIELVRPFVDLVIPAAARSLLKDKFSKIIPVYGSFEDMKILDNQIDFAIQIESLHHAESLHLAAKETYRVLKSGGFLLSIDRSHPDNVSDETLTKLLDHVYPDGFLTKRGYPIGIKLTRRDNGEHEIRDKEWKTAFEDAGFKTEIFKFVAPTLKLWHVKKRLACLFLYWTKRGRRIEIPIRKGILRGFLLQFLGIRRSFFGAIAKGKQERWMTVMVFRKP